MRSIINFFRKGQEEAPKAQGKPLIYRRWDGQEIDMSTWPKEHLDYIKRVYWMYLQTPPIDDFGALALRDPLGSMLGNGQGLLDFPLGAVFLDLKLRLMAKCGRCKKEWEGDIDPVWPL